MSADKLHLGPPASVEKSNLAKPIHIQKLEQALRLDPLLAYVEKFTRTHKYGYVFCDSQAISISHVLMHSQGGILWLSCCYDTTTAQLVMMTIILDCKLIQWTSVLNRQHERTAVSWVCSRAPHAQNKSNMYVMCVVFELGTIHQSYLAHIVTCHAIYTWINNVFWPCILCISTSLERPDANIVNLHTCTHAWIALKILICYSAL